MNYRHAFHAGNFADVMKHVLLARIVAHLKLKPAPFRVVDTHAGTGLYDLAGEEAGRTLEWQDGIGRLDEPFEPEMEALLAPFRQVVADVRSRHGERAYPGSPALVREMIRSGDRAVFVEKHPADAALLSRRFNAVLNTKVLELDGWTALRSLIPPRERRGLVLIDPPYEEPDELGRAAERLAGAVARWPTGIFALWYPVKHPPEIAAFVRRVAATVARDALRLELAVDQPFATGPLAGTGLLVVNPPWTLAGQASLILPALAERLARRADAASWRCEPLATGT